METELSEPIQLTPMLTLAVALLYMMTADGEIEEHESSQLQAVVGGNEDAIDLAMEYVETIPLSQFLQEAPDQLNPEDRLCILCNICDSIMADGVTDSAELALFTQMSDAFGITSQDFDPYFKAIEFKNKKSILGPYDPDNLNGIIIAPHLAMAAGIVYMMSADGNIAKEEIGQLKLMIGEFAGLQTVAMNYVRNFKMSQFLKESVPYLDDPQKLYILTVIFDAMQSDGVIDEEENLLFETIQKAFGVKEEDFKAIRHALTKKNIKPFGLDVIDPKSMHKRRAKRKPHGEGGIFSLNKGKKSNDEKDKRHFNEKKGEWEDTQADTHANNVVHRTLDSNIKDVTEEFKNTADVDLMAANATEKERRLKVAVEDSDPNIQNLDESAAKANIQGVSIDGYKDNNQGLPIDRYNDQMAELDAEVRMDSLQDDIVQLHQKLDQVKPTKKWKRLEALVAFKDPKKKQKDKVGKEALQDNVQAIAAGILTGNLQEVDTESLKDAQKAAASSPLNDNKQPTESASLKTNKQPAESASVKTNIQAVESASVKDNIQAVVTPAVKDNVQEVGSDAVNNAQVLVPGANNSLGDILHTRLVQPQTAQSSTGLSDESSQAPSTTAPNSVAQDRDEQEAQAGTHFSHEDDEVALLESTSLEEDDDGGIRLRTLVLVAAISFPLVVFAYGLVYPTMVCQGQSHQWQTFSPDNEQSSTQMLEDQQIAEWHLLQIRKGEINVNNQRFPLYKELSSSNHFATKTASGFQGVFSNHLVDQMQYTFEYVKSSGELNINTKSEGIRYFDGQSGRVEVNSTFKGQCENRWF
jgi:uncharacterized tellurite resistance protein B-like protein